ncbi:MAG TPA: ATP-binding protein [Gemmatimonadaceae bacterium]|nr:ATP-binding protein [Gemmatimonadaceae bacterium]
MAIGAVVFTGWVLDILWLRRFPPDPIVMLPNTSVGFMMGGLALWILRREDASEKAKRIARGLAVVVFLLGLISFIERVTGLSAGIDRLLFADQVARFPYRPVGLMATNSTICFTLAGGSLLTMDLEMRRGWRPSQLFAAAGLSIATLALVGHLYGASPLYAMDRAAGMALITTLAFCALLVGLLLARPHRGHVALLTADDLGALLARRLLPATILVPLLLGWLFIRGREAAVYSKEGGTALLVLTTIAVLLAIVMRSVVVVRAVDRERQLVLKREEEARAQAEMATQRAQEAAAEAARARAEAEAANRAKSEFLAVMSHELRTPLNAIGGYVELMEMGVRGPVTEAQYTDLARIKRSQAHLLGLINEVLNYTRIEAGAMRYDIAPQSAEDLIATIEPIVAPLLRAKGLSFQRENGRPEYRVLADVERVGQIFINLLSNAVKFTPPGGSVTLRCEPEGDRLAFHISDTGIGIPADQIESIFDPFVQVNTRLTRTEEGIGLGLAISRDLARGMGGDLKVESREGVGSTFTLTLPLAQ